jgi:hypothetical protein
VKKIAGFRSTNSKTNGTPRQNWLERQIEALKDQENHPEGWRKELVRAEVKRLEQL